MNDLSKRITHLSPEQRALFEQRLREKDLHIPASASASLPAADTPLAVEDVAPAERELALSVFFFSADAAPGDTQPYQFLLETARFADLNGFHSIWIPERHFHRFGGLYANPSVLASALAVVTRRLQIRAGSVVLPLHHPVRVVEEWAMVDQLSQGRVGLSFASGWHPDDFVLAPEAYEQRKELMFQSIETVRRLWAGEPIAFRAGTHEVTVDIFPKPLQRVLPVWVTSSGNPDTWIRAGAVGAHVLTALLGQSVDELEEKIKLYHLALRDNGHDPAAANVTLMIHAFIGEELAQVRQDVYQPFCDYLRTHLQLYDTLTKSQDIKVNADKITESDKDALVRFAFERYFSTSALFGTPASVLPMLRRLARIGVTEIACLVDFGLRLDQVLESMRRLSALWHSGM